MSVKYIGYCIICIHIKKIYIYIAVHKKLILRVMMHQLRMPPKEPLLTTNQLSAEFAHLIYKIGCILDESSNRINNLEKCKRICCLLKVSDNTDTLQKIMKKSIKLNFCSVFDTINQHLNWNEHFILTEIIDECDSDEAEKQFQKYKNKMAVSTALQIISSKNHPQDLKNFVQSLTNHIQDSHLKI